MNGVLNDQLIVAENGEDKIDDDPVDIDGHNQRILGALCTSAYWKGCFQVSTSLSVLEIRNQYLEIDVMGVACHTPLSQGDPANDGLAVTFLFKELNSLVQSRPKMFFHAPSATPPICEVAHTDV